MPASRARCRLCSAPMKSSAFSKPFRVLKAHVALTTAHAAGLRVSKVTGLTAPTSTAAAWSSESNAARSYVMVSERLLGILRSYLRAAGTVFVPGSRQALVDRADRPAPSLSFGARRGRHRQTRERARPAPQLLRPISWRAAPTFVSSRSCSDTRICRRRRATRASHRR